MLAGPVDGLLNLVHVFEKQLAVLRVGKKLVVDEIFHKARHLADGGQRVVDLVGNARRHAAEGHKSRRVSELPFDSNPLSVLGLKVRHHLAGVEDHRATHQKRRHQEHHELDVECLAER